MGKRNRRLKDYSGIVFGRLTALRLIERDRVWNNHLWLFRCSCGTEKEIRLKSVRMGHTRSCGCLFSECMVKRNTTHGLTKKFPKEYRSWKDMRSRCRNPNNTDYRNYGGRGISICDRWDDFAAFVEDMGYRPDGLTIDRIDTNGNYEPGNCRWASEKVQANNKRTNVRVTVEGETRTLQEWSDHFGIDRTKARYRLSQGWDMSDVFREKDFRI